MSRFSSIADDANSMKVKVCEAPVYLHSMGATSIHIDVEHPILDHIIEDGERTSCQGKGHGIFISLDSNMLSRAEAVMGSRRLQRQADGALLNERAAEELNEIADALSYLGDETRSIAYRRAARSIAECRDDLAVLAERGNLKSLKWVGPSVAALVEEVLLNGKTAYLEKLRSRLPFSDLLSVEGIDTQTGILLNQRLGISTARELEGLVLAGALWLGPQLMTLEDELTLAIHKRRAARHAPILALLFEGLALVRPLRRRFAATSICYDAIAGGTRKSVLKLTPGRSGIRVTLRAESLPEGVDRKNLLCSIEAIIGREPTTTKAGRVIIDISTKDAAWEFPRVLRDILEG